MKRLLYIVIILLIKIPALFAQTTTTSFDVGGIKVIFKPTVKNVINVRMYYRGGVTNYAPNKSGIENFALQAAAKCGTQKYNANALRDTSDKYDISLSGISNFDYGYIQLNCITKYFNLGWDMFADAITNPAFDSNELQLLKTKLISDSRNVFSNPATRLTETLILNAFKGTAYATNPYGTEETLNDLKPDDIKSYYNNLLNRNRLFIVVVGNITKEQLVEKILFSFGNIPERPYAKPAYETPVWNDNNLLIENREIPLNYVTAIMNTPAVTNIDYIAFRLGVSALSNTIYHDLSTQLKLAFNPGAFCVPMQMPYAQLVLNTNKPQEAIPEMIKVMKTLQKNGVNDEWLMRLKNSFVITNFMNEQSAAAVTNNLGLAEVISGWQYADDLPQLVYMSNTEQVNKALNTYIMGLKWAYLGNPDVIKGFVLPPF